MNSYIKSLLIFLLISLLLSISACSNQSWGDCPIEDRAKVVKITPGSSKNKEVMTIKLQKTKKEVTYPEYTKHTHDTGLKIGDYFCTSEDYD